MSCGKTTQPIEMLFGVWTWVGPRKDVFRWQFTLAPPGECGWTIMWRRCGLFVKLLCPLLITVMDQPHMVWGVCSCWL